MDSDLAVGANLADQTDVLVNKTAHFVGEWIENHATDAPPELPAHIAAEALANECIADAEHRGILPDEINDEVGDLKAYLTETVLAADPLPTSQNG